jgi:hypothetical protein
MSLDFKTRGLDSLKRGPTIPDASENSTFLDLLAYLDAANRPRHKLLEDALATLIRLRRSEQLSSEEMAVILDVLVAANASAEITEAFTNSLRTHHWLHRRPTSSGSWSVLRQSRPLPVRR